LNWWDSWEDVRDVDEFRANGFWCVEEELEEEEV
jgi:hypothetical protein